MSAGLGCRLTMMPMGVRIPAVGGRGLLHWQWQCSMATLGASRSMLPLSIQQRQLPDMPLVRETACVVRPLSGNSQNPFLLPLQCALQDPSVSSSSSLVLLNTKEFADGSIMFRFGTDDERSNSLGHSVAEEVEKKANSNAASTQSTQMVGDSSGFAGIGLKEGNQQDVCLNSAAAMFPHPNKVETGGEDAYFIEGVHWVGVADGVGGWALSGVNAGDYARELMWNCAELAHKGDSSSDPKSVLVKAAEQTNAEGTAAAILASVYDQTLRVANIGDSGFVVVRDAAVVAKSKPMVRGFNFPYQIGTDGDDPITAEAYEFQVNRDDVLVLGSDGIFDNLFEGQIVAVIVAAQKAGSGPEVIAGELVKLAQKVGHMRQGMSPFAVAAHEAGYSSYFGGKLDDTTAVVAIII